MTAFHWAAWTGNLDILLKLWDWAERSPTTEDIQNNLLLATDDDVRTVFHMVVKCRVLELLQDVWEWAN